ncbi:hypothetical protein Emed_003695 [Eimeria media]
MRGLQIGHPQQPSPTTHVAARYNYLVEAADSLPIYRPISLDPFVRLPPAAAAAAATTAAAHLPRGGAPLASRLWGPPCLLQQQQQQQHQQQQPQQQQQQIFCLVAEIMRHHLPKTAAAPTTTTHNRRLLKGPLLYHNLLLLLLLLLLPWGCLGYRRSNGLLPVSPQRAYTSRHQADSLLQQQQQLLLLQQQQQRGTQVSLSSVLQNNPHGTQGPPCSRTSLCSSSSNSSTDSNSVSSSSNSNSNSSSSSGGVPPSLARLIDDLCARKDPRLRSATTERCGGPREGPPIRSRPLL